MQQTFPLTALTSRRIVSAFPAPRNLNGLNLLTAKENVMLKRLTRKLVTLLVLCVALTAVSAASTRPTKKTFCLDDGIGAYGCYGMVCCSEGSCWCLP